MRKVKAFFKIQKFTIMRLLVACWLCYALISNFSLPFDGLAPLFAGGLHDSEASGMGGGSFIEETVLEGHIEEDLAIEDAITEPESFSKPQMVLYNSYSLQKGDMIGDLAANFGLNQDTIISVNAIKNTRLIQVGQVLRVPNQDGILYTVKKGDTLGKIAEKYQSDAESIRFANELFTDSAKTGSVLFIPGGRLDWIERQEINGDLFIWPVSSRRITSQYGWRSWPFGGNRQFHSGLDIGSPMGSPVRAAMSGRVSSAGWDNVLGNYVVITHHSGYRTMYGHMSVLRTRVGAYVVSGERIGDVGSTGLSTGPHLHFTVYKNGVTVNPRTLLR